MRIFAFLMLDGCTTATTEEPTDVALIHPDVQNWGLQILTMDLVWVTGDACCP